MTIADARRATAQTVEGSERARSSRVLALCSALVIALYVISALTSGRGGTGTDMHRLQAAALAEGHLDIRPVPDALAELRDPYDPDQNRSIRREGFHDLAYVDGRLYSTHGITTPLLLAPAEVLFGQSPENWLITLAGGCAGFLAGVWILAQARRRFFGDLPDWAMATCVLAFGLCGPVWFLMWLGNGYEAAIAVAFAFSMGGAAMLLRSTERPARIDRRWAAAGSLCLGLAVGARPSAVVTVVLLAAAAAVVWRRRSTDPSQVVGDLGALAAPFLSFVGVLALANLVRFGSPLEFGNNLQLSIWNMTDYPANRLSYLAPNLRDYLFASPQRTGSFPWIGLRPLIHDDDPSVHSSEAMVGLLYCAPVLLVGAAAATGTGRDMWRRRRDLATTVAAAATTGALALLLISLPFNASTFRYEADAAPFLLLASCGAWAWARQAQPHRRRVLDVCWVAALVIGIVVAASIQLTVTAATGVRA